MTSEPADAYASALEALRVPSQMDGELDTAWEYYFKVHADCDGALPFQCDLYERAFIDAYVAQLLVPAIGQQTDDIIILGIPYEKFRAYADTISANNDAWLRKAMQHVGWFTIRTYGETADAAAFLLIQHSGNETWQQQVLADLRARMVHGETDPQNVAMLTDRIAIKEGSLQQFGTQGSCVAKGQWKARPSFDAEHLNERRAMAGMPPIERYETTMSSKYC
ncbi:MAG: DUF6624 domain-containing protein [Hyphomonas oceanitis]|uniref:DUF6624 domain-containing protein n=1 Tax=Hyphomonas oceanitis TaxID=81033 RepID=UPI00300318EA